MGFSLPQGKAFFLYTREVFASKWAREDFPYNSKYSLYGPIREPHRTINRMNNNNIIIIRNFRDFLYRNRVYIAKNSNPITSNIQAVIIGIEELIQIKAKIIY